MIPPLRHAWARSLVATVSALSLIVGELQGADSPQNHRTSRSSRYSEPYPTAPSKKGLQVEIVEDALALGVRHAALNVDLARVIAPNQTRSEDHWQQAGRTFNFNSD